MQHYPGVRQINRPLRAVDWDCLLKKLLGKVDHLSRHKGLEQPVVLGEVLCHWSKFCELVLRLFRGRWYVLVLLISGSVQRILQRVRRKKENARIKEMVDRVCRTNDSDISLFFVQQRTSLG
jgi:hypothetical protein